MSSKNITNVSAERKSIQWKSYLRKNGINADCPEEFKEIADFIASKMRPLLPR